MQLNHDAGAQHAPITKYQHSQNHQGTTLTLRPRYASRRNTAPSANCWSPLWLGRSSGSSSTPCTPVPCSGGRGPRCSRIGNQRVIVLDLFLIACELYAKWRLPSTSPLWVSVPTCRNDFISVATQLNARYERDLLV
jgi:hypothetical protein